MRPDEHKKKKNALYKKKHGITSSKTSDDSTQSTDTDTKSKVKHRQNRTPDSDNGAQSNNSQKPAVSSNTPMTSVLSDSSSGSDDDKIVQRKSYRRRDVVSNWGKYDLEPEDESARPKGEDFNKLLSMRGETMDHFKFREELEWEDSLQSQMEFSCNDFLALDLEDISSSMACLPIHQILSLDQSVFPEDQLQSYMKDVKARYDSFMNSIEQTHPQMPRQEKSHKTQTEEILLQPNSKSDSKHKKIDSLKNNRVCVSVSNSDRPKENRVDTVQIKKHDFSKDGKAVPGLPVSKETLPATPLDVKDDELDQLLDVGWSVDVKRKNGEEVVKSSKTANVQAPAKKDDKNDAEELEDWLDSILD